MKEENLFPALLPPSNVSYLTTKGMFDFPEKDTMEVWVNGVVVETAVSSHYKKKTSWNKIDNKEEYKWIFVSLDNKEFFICTFQKFKFDLLYIAQYYDSKIKIRVNFVVITNFQHCHSVFLK